MRELYFDLIFIGYYCPKSEDRILLCVSQRKDWVKNYLFEVRGLNKSQVDIREVSLDISAAESLYGDQMLEEYIEPYGCMTRKDIAGLTEEIERTMDRWNDLLLNLKEYREFIEDIPRFQQSISPLIMAERELEFHQGKVKNIQRLCKRIITGSTIASKNINEYLNASKIIYENRELTELFYRAVNDEE